MKLYSRIAGLACMSALMVAAGAGLAASPAKKDEKAKAASEMPAIEKKFPTKVSFDLKSINGKPIPSDMFVTLAVDDSFRGSGNGGCNTWSATVYPVRGQRLAVGPIAVTKKMCDKNRMEVEHMFLSILHASPMWDTNGSELTLKLPNAVMVMQRSL